MDTPELAKKSEADLRAEASAALARARETEVKIESTFALIWREYRVEAIVIFVAGVALCGSVVTLIHVL